MSYDAKERRDTPLARKLKARIRQGGPLRIDQYIEACLYDEIDGYYVSKSAIGRTGDFITAPEISQVFGELIGLWTAAVWDVLYRPKSFNLVEFGPGRGTLMRDALRAMRVLPGGLAAARVILIESDPILLEAQRVTLANTGVPIEWAGQCDPSCVSGRPSIFIGNEFLDVEPIQQFVRTAESWAVRVVGLDDSRELEFFIGPACETGMAEILSRRYPTAKVGDLCQIHPISGALYDALLVGSEPKAALFIDYGHEQSSPGDTLQAVRNHRHEHVLSSPGEADVTAQVDFAQVAERFGHGGLSVSGPVTQAEFLGRIGILERTARLMAANPARAGEIETAVARLMAPSGMGSRFRAIGVRSQGLPELPGF